MACKRYKNLLQSSSMKIFLLCTNEKHPVMPYLKRWKELIEPDGHQVIICFKKAHLDTGDILFLISCSEKISHTERQKFEHVLVLHASDLPKGRGWSPHIWEILAGSSEITLSLIEASNEIDTGDIWKKINIPIAKNMLWDEINDRLFQGELFLMSWAINNFKSCNPIVQDPGEIPTYCKKRTAQDSCLDIDKSLAEQFDLLRVCDPDRYPAYFEIHGRKYKLKLEHYDDEEKL